MAVRAALLVSLAFASAPILAQTPPASQSVAFDVVSVKRHPEESGVARLNFNVVERPDGGLTMTNVPVSLFVARAYALAPVNMVGLPGWASSERYDLSATASLPGVTAERRAAMMKAMLADRFKLAVHFEQREQATFDLVVGRKDGTRAPGLEPIDIDCAKVIAERTAAQSANPPASPPQMPDFKTGPASCTLRSLGAQIRDRFGDAKGAMGDLLEGEGTMAMLASALRLSTGRLVVDKTGLTGSYKMRMNYDQMSARRGPDVEPPPDAGPSVFVAIQDQLGLKLEPSRTMVDTLVIDRLERPTEN